MQLKRAVHDPEGVDLDLSRSMAAPELPLPRPAEQLWLERPPAGTDQAQQGKESAPHANRYSTVTHS
jgi:hypothetical protein